jgi:hypothetical protein
MPRDPSRLQGPCKARGFQPKIAVLPEVSYPCQALVILSSRRADTRTKLWEWGDSRCRSSSSGLASAAGASSIRPISGPSCGFRRSGSPAVRPQDSGANLGRKPEIVEDQCVDRRPGRGDAGCQANLTRRSRRCPKSAVERPRHPSRARRLPHGKPCPRTSAVAARRRRCARTCCGGRLSSVRGSPVSPKTAVKLEHPRLLDVNPPNPGPWRRLSA